MCIKYTYRLQDKMQTYLILQGFGSNCPAPISRGVTAAEKAQIVSLHNKKRSQVANGQEARGSSGPQPPAADMLEMRWDNELAAIAQTWADQCQFGHDTTRDVSRFKVGQNVYIHASTNGGSTPWRRGINSWYDEVKIYSNRDINSYRYGHIGEKESIVSNNMKHKFTILQLLHILTLKQFSDVNPILWGDYLAECLI